MQESGDGNLANANSHLKTVEKGMIFYFTKLSDINTTYEGRSMVADIGTTHK